MGAATFFKTDTTPEGDTVGLVGHIRPCRSLSETVFTGMGGGNGASLLLLPQDGTMNTQRGAEE
jgi:hypothetical protein